MATGQTVTFGPYGGSAPQGTAWDDGTYSTVREVKIYSGAEIFSLQVVYDNEGKEVSGKRHGGDGGTLNTLKLNYPTEYLVSISGYLGLFYNRQYLVVKSLTLQSNIKQYGPYGTQEGTLFTAPVAGGKIVGGKIAGFLGREGIRLDSIGVHIKPFPITIPSVGPFGTTGGQQWDDGTYSTIRELIIHSGAVIDSIQVVYDLEGRSVSGQKHGTDGGSKTSVKLEYPGEFLLSISGYYGQVDNMVVIRSIGFQSNKRMIGPFGIEDGAKFQSPLTCGKIIGFYGSSDKYLTSIGAYLDKLG